MDNNEYNTPDNDDTDEFDRAECIRLAKRLRGAVGCRMRKILLEPDTGSEKCIVILDRSKVIDRFANRQNVTLFLKALIGVPRNPVSTMIFGFTEDDALLAAYRMFLTPDDSVKMKFLEAMAQEEEHTLVYLATDATDTIHVARFNLESLPRTVNMMKASMQLWKPGDYSCAKRDFAREHSFEKLLRIGEQHFTRLADVEWNPYRYSRRPQGIK